MTQKLMEAIHPQNMNVALVTNNLVEGPEQKHEKQLSWKDENQMKDGLGMDDGCWWMSMGSNGGFVENTHH